jgi:hypothetical protein
MKYGHHIFLPEYDLAENTRFLFETSRQNHRELLPTDTVLLPVTVLF